MGTLVAGAMRDEADKKRNLPLTPAFLRFGDFQEVRNLSHRSRLPTFLINEIIAKERSCGFVIFRPPADELSYARGFLPRRRQARLTVASCITRAHEDEHPVTP
jgi:hypothetical protein